MRAFTYERPVDMAAALVGVDLALDRMDILDGVEIERLAPDEGLHVAQE